MTRRTPFSSKLLRVLVLAAAACSENAESPAGPQRGPNGAILEVDPNDIPLSPHAGTGGVGGTGGTGGIAGTAGTASAAGTGVMASDALGATRPLQITAP